MSNYNYNPLPPRVWSRVQNPCTYIVPGSDYIEAYIPVTKQTVSQAQADYEMKQIYKGNILQYKGNSARLTKSQKYSQLARCAGPNRTKVFATQTQTYTNPNTTGLLRLGSVSYPYPNQIVGAPNNISGPFAYNIQNPNDCSSNSVEVGGTLVCGTSVNPCSGEIYIGPNKNATICNSASASDVPGSSILCWNKKVQTWFPRQRYFMNNSTDKWPVNYKGFVNAVSLPTPTLSAFVDPSNCTTILLNWKMPKSCYDIDSYNIYLNNQFYISVSSTLKSYGIPVNFGLYSIYITAIANNLESRPSNNTVVFVLYESVIITNDNLLIKPYSYTSSGITYKGVIFLPFPYTTSTQESGQASFSICQDISGVSIFLVGGGGAGGDGNFYYNGGAGGGSGGVNYIQNAKLLAGNVYTIRVGLGGYNFGPAINKPGSGGGPSSFTSSDLTINYLSTGGQGGGSTNSIYGGGNGGNATKTGTLLNATDFGYGGSGGGGAWTPDGTGAEIAAGLAGTGYTSNGNPGTAGTSIISGNGGNSVFSPLFLPFYNGNIYNGGAGGGGGKDNGGGAGHNCLGGAGRGSSGRNGQVASYSTTPDQDLPPYLPYIGAGGGGGGNKDLSYFQSNWGGWGGAGVCAIWWQV